MWGGDRMEKYAPRHVTMQSHIYPISCKVLERKSCAGSKNPFLTLLKEKELLWY